MKAMQFSSFCWMVILLAGWGLSASSCSGRTDTVTKKERTIKVTGSAEMDITPDEFQMTVGIQEYYEKGKKVNLETIQQQLNTEFDSLGIKEEDVKIDQLSAYSNWWWYYYYKKELLKSMQISVTLHDIQAVGKFVTTLKTKGIYSVTTGRMENSQIEKLRIQVKSQAIKAAKEKAAYLLDGLGKKLGDVVSIEEVNNSNIPQWWDVPQQLYSNSTMMYGEGLDKQSTQWSSKNITLRYEINAEFEIL